MGKVTDRLQTIFNQIYQQIPQAKPAPSSLKNVKIVAHRGAWNNMDRIENTFSSFDLCLNKKIWAIEFDIRWTNDNVPIVHHDSSLQRLFSIDKNITDLSAHELKKLAPIIPTLGELLERYSKQFHFMIELKNTPTLTQVQILSDHLKHLKPIENYHIMSLNIDDFSLLSFLPKKSFVSIARMNIKDIFKKTLLHNYGAFTGQYLLLSEKMRKKCQNQGIKVGTGFPENNNTFYREVNRNVDWIFTNNALELSQLITD